MAYDELQRDPPQLMADFIEHTRGRLLGPPVLQRVVPEPRP